MITYTLIILGTSITKTSDLYEKVSNVPNLAHHFPGCDSDHGILEGMQVTTFTRNGSVVAYIVKNLPPKETYRVSFFGSMSSDSRYGFQVYDIKADTFQVALQHCKSHYFVRTRPQSQIVIHNLATGEKKVFDNA
jgi:hypothetical protein